VLYKYFATFTVLLGIKFC